MGDEPSTRSTRLSGGLDDKFAEYRDENDMTNSEALRTLVRNALEAEDEPEAPAGTEDPNRPDEALGALLYDARQDRKNNLTISLVAVTLAFAFSLPVILEGVLLLSSVLWGLSAFFGYVEGARQAFDPDPAGDAQNGTEAVDEVSS